MLRSIGPDDRAFLKGKQPYPAPHGERPETHALAMLRKLANIDKHRVLHTALLYPLDIDVTLIGADVPRVIDTRLFLDNPLKDGAKFARVWTTPGPAPEVDVETDLSFYVGLTGPEYGWMDRGSLFFVLKAIRSEVEFTIASAAYRF